MSKVKNWVKGLDFDLLMGIVVIIALIGLVTGVVVGRGCSSTIILEPIQTDIDASVVENEALAQRLELERKANEEIRQLEEDYRERMDNWDIEQAREYEKVKKRGPGAVADWLTDFNRSLDN